MTASNTSKFALAENSEEFDIYIALLERCKQQDEEALRSFFKQFEKPIYGFLYRMLSNKEDAEEALAEVFIKIWKFASSFEGESKFTTWLYKIAANCAKDKLRSRLKRKEIFFSFFNKNDGVIENISSGKDNIESEYIKKETIESITKAMEQLSYDDRLLIELHHIQEWDYNQISDFLGIKTTQLKIKLFRARQKLKSLLEGDNK
ncbi:MAG: RNA polymerase sigma factor [Armatimonadota bacterium]